MKITLKEKFNGFGLFLISQIYRKTCRLEIKGLEEAQKAAESGRPIIITSWHGHQMLGVVYIQKYFDIKSFVGLMPDDDRGGSLLIFAKFLKVHPFSMNLYGDTTMDQGRQLVKVVRLLKDGKNLAIGPDGPDGPSYQVKPGLSYFAKKTNALIIPFGAYCRHAYIIPRWDQYILPYPFSRVSIHIGEPYEIPDNVEELSEIDRVLQEKLNRVTLQAAANYYEK